MANLYEINEKLIEAMARAELQAVENDGEIEEATREELDRLEMDRADKIENTALFIKNISAEIEMIKAEEKNLKKRRQSLEKKQSNISEWLQYNLHGEKVKSGKFSISYRNSVSVSIADELLIPQEYTTEVVSIKVDKMAIKKAINSGSVVDGARLVEKTNMTIK